MINKEQIKKVLAEMCIKPFAKLLAKLPWDIDVMAGEIAAQCELYKVDPRLCLAQGIVESHFCCNPAAKRSIKNHNIFNVGNMDNGANKYFATYAQGLSAYCRLMSRYYHWRNEGSYVTPEMMIAHDFKGPKGGRYATALNYVPVIKAVLTKIDKAVKA